MLTTKHAVAMTSTVLHTASCNRPDYLWTATRGASEPCRPARRFTARTDQLSVT